MKKNLLLLCSVSIILLSAGAASAKKAVYPNILSASGWSALPAPVKPAAAGDYKNIADAARWSSLPRPIAPAATRKSMTAPQDPGDADELFGLRPTWKDCVRQCLDSALRGTGTLCVSNCTACALVGAPWSCALCAACGIVGFASVEFCTLHCCVNPGCPAMVEMAN